MKICLRSSRIWVWALVLLMVVSVLGCGKRASHGSHRYSKGLSKAQVIAHQPDGSQRDSFSSSSEPVKSGTGYFSDGAGSFGDLLEADDYIQEDPQFGQEGGRSESGDYWVNRTRAERFTEQSGLEDVHFDFDSVQLNERAKMILMANAEWLKANPDADVTIEGHCDDRGTSSYNYVLGEKRALRTKNYLVRLGVSANRLHVMSFGKDHPACWDPTEPCYQKNRRAHLVLGLTVAATAMR